MCQIDISYGNSCSTPYAICNACMPLDHIWGDREGISGVRAAQLFHILSPRSHWISYFFLTQILLLSLLSTLLSKPCGDGGTVTVTGAGWHWKLLAVNLHTGGHGKMVVVTTHLEARVDFGPAMTTKQPSTGIALLSPILGGA